MKSFRQKLQMLWWDWGRALPVLALIALAIGLIAWRVGDAYTVKERFLAPVVGFQDISGDDGYAAHFTVARPDGQRVQLRSRRPALTARLGDTVCVDLRQHDSGRETFAFSLDQTCPPL